MRPDGRRWDVMRPLLTGLIMTAVTGCAMGDEAPGDGTTGGEQALDAPRFPFGDTTLTIDPTQRDPLMLRATSIDPNLTFALVDGQSVAQAGYASRYGSLEEGLLVLNIDGMLTSGERTLQLATNHPEQTLRSRVVRLEVLSPPAESLPRLSVEPARATLGAAAAIYGRPGFERTSLGLLDDARRPTELSIVVRGEARWLTGTPLRVPLANVVADDLSSATEIVDHAIASQGEDGRSYRVVWREAISGTRVHELEVRSKGTSGATLISDVADEVDAVARAVRVEQLRLVGDAIAIAVAAPHDLDAPRPGDRSVFAVNRDPATGAPLAAQRLTQASLSDLDDLDAAHTTASLDPERLALSLRSHQTSARTLTRHDGAPGLRLGSDLGLAQYADFPDTWMSRHVFVGALSSRTVVGIRKDGRVRVVTAIESSSTRRRQDFDDQLPATGVSGEASAAVMRGMAVVVVPFGDDAPVHAVVVSGDQTRIEAVGDLHCDEIVLDASARARDEGVSDVACLSQGEVTLHEVALVLVEDP